MNKYEVDWEDICECFPGCSKSDEDNYDRFRYQQPEIDLKLWYLVSAQPCNDHTFKKIYIKVENYKKNEILLDEKNEILLDEKNEILLDERNNIHVVDHDLYDYHQMHETDKFLNVIYVFKQNRFPNAHFGIGDYENEFTIDAIPINVKTMCIHNGYIYILTKDNTTRVIKNASKIEFPEFTLSHILGKNLQIFVKNTFEECHNTCIVNQGCQCTNFFTRCLFCEKFNTKRHCLIEIHCSQVRCIDTEDSVCFVTIGQGGKL